MKRVFLAAALFFGLQSLAEADLKIKEYPIDSPLRRELTREYSRKHYGIDSDELKYPTVIVIHATEIPTLKGSLEVFKPAELPAHRKELVAGGRLNVGVHYVVDRNGDIYSLLPLNRMGRHAIGYNHTAIGIENVGHTGDLTEAQLYANAELVHHLDNLHSIYDVMGHYETQVGTPTFSTPRRMMDPLYRPTVKLDPGSDFMWKLRRLIESSRPIRNTVGSEAAFCPIHKVPMRPVVLLNRYGWRTFDPPKGSKEIAKEAPLGRYLRNEVEMGCMVAEPYSRLMACDRCTFRQAEWLQSTGQSEKVAQRRPRQEDATSQDRLLWSIGREIEKLKSSFGELRNFDTDRALNGLSIHYQYALDSKSIPTNGLAELSKKSFLRNDGCLLQIDLYDWTRSTESISTSYLNERAGAVGKVYSDGRGLSLTIRTRVSGANPSAVLEIQSKVDEILSSETQKYFQLSSKRINALDKFPIYDSAMSRKRPWTLIADSHLVPSLQLFKKDYLDPGLVILDLGEKKSIGRSIEEKTFNEVLSRDSVRVESVSDAEELVLHFLHLRDAGKNYQAMVIKGKQKKKDFAVTARYEQLTYKPTADGSAHELVSKTKFEEKFLISRNQLTSFSRKERVVR